MESLREQLVLEIAEKTSVYMLGKNYHEQEGDVQEYLLSLGNSVATQILSLITERIKGIENPYEGTGKSYEYRAFNEAIQRVLEELT